MSLYSKMSLKAGRRPGYDPRKQVANYLSDLKLEAKFLKIAVSEAKEARILRAVTDLKKAMKCATRFIAAIADTGEITPEEVQQYNREATKVYEDAMASRNEAAAAKESSARAAAAAKESSDRAAAAAKAEDDRLKLLGIWTKNLDYFKSRAFELAAGIENKLDKGAVLDQDDIEDEIFFLEKSLCRVKEAADDLKAVMPPSDNLGDQAEEAVYCAEKEVNRMVMKLKEIQQAQVAVPFGSGESVSDAGRSGQGATSGTNSSSYIVRGGGGGSRTSSNSDIVRGGGGRSRSSFKKNYNSSKICTSKSQFGSTVSGTMQNSIAAAACSQGSGGSISGAVLEVQVVDVTRCIWTPFPRTKKVSKTFFKPGNKMFPPGQKATKNLSGKVEIFTSLPHNSSY